MRLFKTIRDKDVGLNIRDPAIYGERNAARAVVFDNNGDIALLHVTKMHHHKLPGGGIEEGEEIIEALKREAIEEIGCAVHNIRELGIIDEFRNQLSLHQTSYCFIANVEGEKGISRFDEGELASGFEPVWVSLDNAIQILEQETNIDDYEGKFIRIRDLLFLKEAKKEK